MKASITALFVLGIAATAAASEQERAAVLEFDLAQAVPGVDRIYFSDRARSALHDSGTGLFVMTRESTEALLQANGKTMADCTGQCEVEIGRKLGADYIVSGRITRIGSQIALTMRLFATKDGELLSAAEARGRDVDELQDRMDASLAKLFAPLGVSASAASIQVEAPQRMPAAVQSAPAERAQVSGTVDVLVRSALGQDLAGASIAVDGRAAGTAPASLELTAGEHFILASKDLYISGKVRIVIKGNDIQKVAFDLKPDFATVNITSDPDDSAITIDGVSAGRTPLKELRIKTGQHKVVAERAEYVSASIPLAANAGERLDLPVKLAPDFAPLCVESVPSGAEVFIDGKSVGRTPLDLPRVKIGQHSLEVKGEPIAYVIWRRTIEVKRGSRRETIEASLSRREADVLITSQPPGATVWLDGNKEGETSLKVRLLGGDHELRTTLVGYAPKKQVIRVVPPDQLHVKVQLSRGGSGPDHRFTLADLELQYHPEPAKPDFLPTSTSVEERALKGTEVAAGIVVWGGLTGIVAGYATSYATCSPDSAKNCTTDANIPLSIGVGAASALVTSAIFYAYKYWSAPVQRRDVPDSDAIAVNSERQRTWDAQKSEVDGYNRSIDHRLRIANAAFESDRVGETNPTTSGLGRSYQDGSGLGMRTEPPVNGAKFTARKAVRYSKEDSATNKYADGRWKIIPERDRRHNAATLTWDEVDALPASQMLSEELARWSELHDQRRHSQGKK